MNSTEWIDYQMYEFEKIWRERQERQMYEKLMWYNRLQRELNILKLNKNITVL